MDIQHVFERRLVEEASKLRVEMGAMEGRLAHRMDGVQSAVLRWSFVFWIGQVIAMTAIISALLGAG